MKSRIGYFLAGTTMVLSLFLVSGVVLAATDATLVKPVLQRYDLGGKSYSAPFTDEVVLNKGDKLTLAGASQAGGRVTLIVGTKSIKTDGVSNGTWATDIVADELPAGTDTIVGQTVVGDRTSELVNLLNIKVAGAATEAEEGLLKNPYILGGAAVLLLALMALVAKKFKLFSSLTKKKSKKK